jgi:acrylyl-CoA reductase (NADPH)
MKTYRALRVALNETDVTRKIENCPIDGLPAGDVLIRVHWSSLNYKDALSANGNKGVTRTFPHTPGIDAAGIVEESVSPLFAPGDEVLVTGYDLGMNTYGGFAEYIRVPTAWVVALPRGMSLNQCMQLGTAGLTAALAVHRILKSGVTPVSGPALVTGASGGLGTIAVALLKKLGFQVDALSGKKEAHAFLIKLGARAVIGREEFTEGSSRLLLKPRWAAVVDTVGGDYLSIAIRSTMPNGCVAVCGNAASGDLAVNVYPFILRGVSVVGVDSAEFDMDLRKLLWQKLADEWSVPHIDEITATCKLDNIEEQIERILRGGQIGRYVIDIR